MRILFFHGFESTLPSKKASWLEGEGYCVYARPMGYDRTDAFFGALATAREFKPDVLIGSSMGGYFASLVGTHLNARLVLFNPALHSRTREYEHKKINNINAPYKLNPLTTRGQSPQFLVQIAAYPTEYV